MRGKSRSHLVLALTAAALLALVVVVLAPDSIEEREAPILLDDGEGPHPQVKDEDATEN